MAESLARRLLPAFNTPTGLPYGTINLRYGVPSQETPITCVSCCSSFIMEFGTLSRLTGIIDYCLVLRMLCALCNTGDPVFEETAVNAITAIWKRRSKIGLVCEKTSLIKYFIVAYNTKYCQLCNIMKYFYLVYLLAR